MKAGTCLCTVTKALGATGPAPEQGLHGYLQTEHRRTLEQERAEQGHVAEGLWRPAVPVGLGSEMGRGCSSSLDVGLLLERPRARGPAGKVQLASCGKPRLQPQPGSAQDPQGSCVRTWLQELCPIPPAASDEDTDV